MLQFHKNLACFTALWNIFKSWVNEISELIESYAAYCCGTNICMQYALKYFAALQIIYCPLIWYWYVSILGGPQH